MHCIRSPEIKGGAFTTWPLQLHPRETPGAIGILTLLFLLHTQTPTFRPDQGPAPGLPSRRNFWRGGRSRPEAQEKAHGPEVRESRRRKCASPGPGAGKGSRAMGRSRSRSPPRRERRRSRSPSRERERRRRERSRSRERDRRRSRSRSPHRRRSRSPRRHRSNSDSPSRQKERREDEKKDGKDKERHITEEDLEGKTEEEIEMMKMMGFGSFDTTKGKKVDGSVNAYAVNVSQKRKYRQYMNRKGGFNRPLDFIA
ncbi:U4/U6.U5 small nuclear ribonucleoprotein 27 kDa protein [Erythrolamprus reginae]|uniref:U4/U6.U5 small nuclear ribonucleoprotein 27 kDa protein n=1 Tax=Erythrolamprus reginae TaxID=121349 RepID=UPI00396C4435